MQDVISTRFQPGTQTMEKAETSDTGGAGSDAGTDGLLVTTGSGAASSLPASEQPPASAPQAVNDSPGSEPAHSGSSLTPAGTSAQPDTEHPIVVSAPDTVTATPGDKLALSSGSPAAADVSAEPDAVHSTTDAPQPAKARPHEKSTRRVPSHHVSMTGELSGVQLDDLSSAITDSNMRRRIERSITRSHDQETLLHETVRPEEIRAVCSSTKQLY